MGPGHGLVARSVLKRSTNLNGVLPGLTVLIDADWLVSDSGLINLRSRTRIRYQPNHVVRRPCTGRRRFDTTPNLNDVGCRIRVSRDLDALARRELQDVAIHER